MKPRTLLTLAFSLGPPSPFARRYRNYPPEQLVDLVARLLAFVPPWTRVYRIQRDIPMPLVTSGVEKGNLRELALQRMADLGTRCRDVRTREAGIQVRTLATVVVGLGACFVKFAMCCRATHSGPGDFQAR